MTTQILDRPDTELIKAADIINGIQASSAEGLEAELAQSIKTSDVHRARFLIALGEFEERDLAESRGAKNCAAFLARHYGQSKRAAQDFRTQARRLHKWPRVAMLMLAERLTYSKMRIVLRYITEENQDELLEIAQKMTYEDLRLKLSGCSTNDEEDKEKDDEEYVRLWVNPETGWLTYTMHLSPDHAAEFLAALKGAELLMLRDLTESDAPIELRGQELADFLDTKVEEAREEAEEACPPETMTEKPPYHRRLGPDEILDPLDEDDLERIEWAEYQRTGDYSDHQAWADDGGPVHDESVDPTTPERARPPRSQTRYGPPQSALFLGAFLTMIRSFLSRPRSEIRAPGAEVNVIVGPDGQVRLPGHTGATAAQLLPMILNGILRIHLQDWRGATVEMGSPRRMIPAAVEKAVLAAWNYQCATPGCTHSRFLQFHHIVFYSEGGTTDTFNIIVLCSGCHAMVTGGRMTIHIDESDPRLLHFRMPGGRSFTSYQRTIPMENPDAEDGYLDGAVPKGDEHLVPIIDMDDLGFDD